MKKNVFLVIFCLLLCSQAYGQALVNGVYYTFSGTNAEVTYGTTKYTGDVVIPSTVFYNGTNRNVTSIGVQAFSGCSGLTSVSIPESVTNIKNYAFGYCSSLTLITIPENVISIGVGAFDGCRGLASINVSYENTNYSSDEGVLFNGDKTTLIRCPERKTGVYAIPESVTSINNYAFRGCQSLTSITIPENVTSIGYYVFLGCIGLASINVEEENANFLSENGVLFSKNKTILIAYPGGKMGNYIIPSGVISIADGAFSNSIGLTSIIISEGVINIGFAAFSDCSNLATVSFPSSVAIIDGGAFENCSSLISVINLNPEPIKIIRVFSGVHTSTCTLYVPVGSETAYLDDYDWEKFIIIELPEISEEDIDITPSKTSALIEWQPYENAEGYRIIIYSDEAHIDTIFILEFDAEGKWFNTISFRSASVNLSYTIENLLSGTDYYYTFEILGVGDVVLASLSDKFTTEKETVNINVPFAAPAEVVGYYSILGTKLPQEPAKGMYIILYSDGKTKKILK